MPAHSELERELVNLLDEIDRYAWHYSQCEFNMFEDGPNGFQRKPCDCGYDAAEAKVVAILAKTQSLATARAGGEG